VRILLALLACSGLLAAARPDAVFVLKSSQLAPKAFRTAMEQIGPDACDCTLTGETVDPARIARTRLLFLEHPTAELLARLKPVALDAIRRGLIVVTDAPESVQRAWGVDLPYAPASRMMPYWQNGGEENLVGFFLWGYKLAGGDTSLSVPEPKEVPRSGVYHPSAPRSFRDLTSYLEWYRKAKPGLGALAVVTIYPTFVNKGDTAFIDALLVQLEKEGLAAAAVYGWPHNTLEGVLRTPPEDPVKVMLAFTLSIPRPGDAVALEKQNVHVINLMITRESYAEWAAGVRGITIDRISSSVAAPERLGATEPIVVATTESAGPGELTRTMPIPERVEAAAKRARRWVTLAEKPNWEKRIVMLYYNNPPGKGNLGASYLNLAPSIRAAIEKLRENGYIVGPALPAAEELMELLERSGRNIESWAPGELRRMVERGGLKLIPMHQYKEWFAKLPKKFRDEVNARWGPPEACELMCLTTADGKLFVIPGFHLGNVFLGPQLLRASAAEYTNVQHSGTLPPHHGYVAAYLYYRHQFKADAIIHMGRHGTLEWLPGKAVGQAGWDSAEVLLGDLPNLNFYIMDGDWEAVQARRRGLAVDISHLTPLLARAGKDARFAALEEAIKKWEETLEESPLLAEEYKGRAVTELKRLKLLEQLNLDPKRPKDLFARVHEFLESMQDAPMPLGLATLGEPPNEDRQREGLTAFLGSAFDATDAKLVRPHLAAWVEAILGGNVPQVPESIAGELRERVFRAIDEAHGWLARLRASAPRELESMVRVLRGEFLPSGLAGDPLAVPDALPSGRNLHLGDPALVPTKAAYAVGVKLAKQLLDRHLKQHGRYPETVSMVLWGGETGRHQGVMEAQALYLMGVEPEWNARGVPDRLKLIPDAELGRPRVNVIFTVSGGYRDAFGDKIVMLDRASRLAASAGDNAISRHTRAVRKELEAQGVPAAQADDLAGARVFATAPGAYGIGISNFVDQSRDKDEPQTMADLYLSKLNHAYTEKSWGVSQPKLLEKHLRGNEAILHSRSSNLYGALDNDDVFEWMGGLRVASERAGAKPELLMQNLRRPGQEKLEAARDFIYAELNSRNWNPKWISEMQKEGYSGARAMMKGLEFLYGWQATAPETVPVGAWQKMYEVYVNDEYKLGLNEFFDKKAPAAKQALVARLLEIDRQGTHRFTVEERRRLVSEYVKLVARGGVTCSANVCGNRRLRDAVLQEAGRMLAERSLAPNEMADFLKSFEQAVRSGPVRKVYTLSAVKSGPRKPKPTWSLRFVRIADFVGAAGRKVRDNPLAFAIFGGGSGLLGIVIALMRRRTARWVGVSITNG